MQAEIVVTMERRPVVVHGRYGSLIGWFQRSNFLGNNQKPIGLVEFPNGTVHEFEAKEVRYVDER